MTAAQDIVREKAHYEGLFTRTGDHHFIENGYEWIHARTVDLLRPGSRVLDVGCGTGQHARLFARKGLRVAGVELSERAVDICREAFARLSLRGEFTCGDVRNLPFPNASFDACFLSLILHHFLDYRQVLAEAARVARRFVFVFEPNAWNPQSLLLLNVINPILRPGFLSPNQRAVSPRRVREFMESCGYRQRSLEFATLGSTQRYSLVKALAYRVQQTLPRSMRHSKFLQVFEPRRPSFGVFP